MERGVRDMRMADGISEDRLLRFKRAGAEERGERIGVEESVGVDGREKETVTEETRGGVGGCVGSCVVMGSVVMTSVLGGSRVER